MIDLNSPAMVAFLAALSKTPREWRLDRSGGIARRSDGFCSLASFLPRRRNNSFECFLTDLGATRFGLSEHESWAIISSNDNRDYLDKYHPDPTLRAALLEACGLTEGKP